MQDELLLSVRVDWTIDVGPGATPFVISEGRCEGAVSGRYRGASIRRAGDPYDNLRGTIDTEDGATMRLRRTGGRIELVGDELHPTIVGPGTLELTADGFAVFLRPRALAA